MHLLTWFKLRIIVCITVLLGGLFLSLPFIYASTPNAGGDTTVVNPSGEGAVSVNEDAAEPESANIRLIVPTLIDPGGGTPSSIRILSVTGGSMKQGGGGSITLGTSGTVLSLSSSRVDLRFKPTSNWNTNASFQYVVVDPHDSSVNSTASTATITINSVNDTPLLQTVVGSTGTGLAGTYYLNQWDLTGSTANRVDATVNFSNNFGVTGLNTDQFSVRWTGKVESPITGNVTFSTQSDDGVRLWVNGEKIIDNWTVHGTTTDTASPVALTAGTKYDIQMEFYERGGGEVAILQWSYSGQSTQVIPQQYLYPATVRPALKFITGSGAVVIDDGITLSDVDSTTMATGSAEISSNFQNGEDVLQFTNQNGISGSYSNGVMSLSGSATVAQYQTALRSIKYYNSAGSPNTSTRTVRFRVYDGSDQSNYVFRDIEFSGTNTPPVITQGTSASVTMDEDSSPTAFSLTLDATDADEHSISWSISSQPSHGTASAGDPGNSTSITYTPKSNYFGEDSFVVQASDGVGGTDTITVNVTITSDGIDESNATVANSSSSSDRIDTSCRSDLPTAAPDLFQISVSLHTATLYFSPVSPVTGYVVSYGTAKDANEHSVSFNYANDTGAVSYSIKALDEGTTYYFRVSGKNSCVEGPWSSIVKTRTTGGLDDLDSITSTLTSRGTIDVVEKKQTSKETPKQTDVEKEKSDGHELIITVKHDGKPVEGAVVEVHSIPRRTVTDKDGNARFSNVESGDHTVYLSYEGYKGQEKISLAGENKEVAINFVVELHPSSTYMSKTAMLIIGFLILCVGVLFFLLFKRRKKKSLNNEA